MEGGREGKRKGGRKGGSEEVWREWLGSLCSPLRQTYAKVAIADRKLPVELGCHCVTATIILFDRAAQLLVDLDVDVIDVIQRGHIGRARRAGRDAFDHV